MPISFSILATELYAGLLAKLILLLFFQSQRCKISFLSVRIKDFFANSYMRYPDGHFSHKYADCNLTTQQISHFCKCCNTGHFPSSDLQRHHSPSAEVIYNLSAFPGHSQGWGEWEEYNVLHNTYFVMILISNSNGWITIKDDTSHHQRMATI